MGLDGLQEGPVGVVGRPNNYLRNILLTHAHILIPPVLSVPSVAGKEERRGARRDEVGKEAQERVASAGRRTERGVNGGAFDGGSGTERHGRNSEYIKGKHPWQEVT